MSEQGDLLAACVAAPDDDASRLVWADAIGGERGELVVIQCALARGDRPPAETAALRRRQDALLAEHGAAWSGLAGLAKRCVFRRGFVDAVELDAGAPGRASIATLQRHAPLMTALATVGLAATIDYRESSERTGPDALAILARMFDEPGFTALRGFSIDGAVVYELTGDTEWDFDSTSLGDHVLELVARSGRLGALTAFGFDDALTARGHHELVGSNVLPGLERLRLRWPAYTDRRALRDVLRAAPRLRALDLGAAPLAMIADAIPASVVELRSFGGDPDELAVLAASPVAGSLQRLAFTGKALGDDLDLFARFPRLRALDVGACSAGRNIGVGRDVQAHVRAVERFASTAPSLPALRELRVFSDLEPVSILAIADAFGPQLERLDCLAHHHLAPLAPEIERRLAGELMLGAYLSTDQIIATSVDPREPWLHHGLVTLAAG